MTRSIDISTLYNAIFCIGAMYDDHLHIVTYLRCPIILSQPAHAA